MARKRQKSSKKASGSPGSSKKLWGGGYAKKTSGIVEQYTESVSFDYRLAPFDIRGSLVHAEMLAKQKIITKADFAKIRAGLTKILAEIEAGKFVWKAELEDVHMNVESELTRRIGEPGKRLHTGRSRNDQVATAFRLYCADAAIEATRAIGGLLAAIMKVKKAQGDVILPGYTHLQQGQPVAVSRYLGAYEAMFVRDTVRFDFAEESIMFDCPLGAGALAGSTLPLDRKFTARKLGFSCPAENTMDAVSNRDFAVELLAAASLLAVHLSRLSEDLIIYCSKEFSFVKLDDSVTTGSSLMPQKKNPDVCELTRGKTGRVIGNLVSLLTTLKGLPMTYNRDMQEDKEPVFDAMDTVIMATRAMTEVVATMKFNEPRIRASMDRSMLATDLAEHLVEKGVPFREAHEIIARLVHSSPDFSRIDSGDLKLAHPLLADAARRLTFEEAVRRRKS